MRRARAFAMACAVAALALTGLPAVTASSAQAATTWDPNSPTLVWGASARPRSGENWQTALQHLETKAGRSMAATRVYWLWDQPFPDTYTSWLATTDTMPLISVKPQKMNGTAITWSSIANATPGSTIQNQIDGWADKIKAYGVPVYFTFNHEPEAAASNTFGTDAQFIAAWRHVVQTFRDRGVTNAKFMWIMTGYAFGLPSTDRRQAIKWFPGDDWIDAMGDDEYNDFTCRDDSKAPWKNLSTELEQFRKFGLLHPTKEMWVTEYGSVEDPNVAGRKAAWIDQARADFKDPKWSQFKGVLYFHSYRPGVGVCQWWVDSSASSMASFAAMGADPFYTAHVGDVTPPPPPPPPPPPGTHALLVVGNTTLAAGDEAMRAHLAGLGYTVTTVDDNVVQASDTTGQDVVVITSTSDNRVLLKRLHDVTAPVLLYKPTLFDDMGLSKADATIAKSTSVDITDPTSPLAAGRSGTVQLLTSSDYMGSADPAGLGSGAQLVATVGGRPTIVDYPAGATLADGTAAPGCRVAFPAYHTSVSKLNQNGKDLLDASLSWLDACN